MAVIKNMVLPDGTTHQFGVDLEDSGWKTPTLNSRFTQYSTDQSLKYRKYGKQVFVRGAVKPTSAIAASTTNYPIFTLPANYRPAQQNTFVCQGSGTNRWLCTVLTDGTVNFARLGAQASTTEWLTMSFSFLVENANI